MDQASRACICKKGNRREWKCTTGEVIEAIPSILDPDENVSPVENDRETPEKHYLGSW